MITAFLKKCNNMLCRCYDAPQFVAVTHMYIINNIPLNSSLKIPEFLNIS